MNIFHKVLEFCPDTKVGRTDRRTDGCTYGTDRGNTLCPSAILRIRGGIKNEKSFCTAKASHVFSTKNIGIVEILAFEILTKR